MWKKDEGMPSEQPGAEAAPRSEAPRAAPGTSERATIGRSITIRGDVGGDEDLLIQGQIDGSVDLDLHAVTVGREGRVNANITGRVVTVEGQVEGDLNAQEQVILRSSAQVVGDIKAPRVVLEDGASFRGLVDMGAPPEQSNPASAGSATKVKSKGGPEAASEVEAVASTSAITSGNSGGSSRTQSAKAKSESATVGKATP